MTGRWNGRSERRRGSLAAVVALGIGVAIALLAAACGAGGEVAWGDIPVIPGAEAYEGPNEAIMTDWLARRVDGQGLRLRNSRLEYLPPGVAWKQHRAWRSDHAAGMTEANERPTIPDQDPPVSETRYSNGTSTLLVIGRADEAGERLVVLTALATDR